MVSAEGCHVSGTSADVMSNVSQRGLLKGPNKGIFILGDRVLLWGRRTAPAWVFSRTRIPAF